MQSRGAARRRRARDRMPTPAPAEGWRRSAARR